MIPTNREAQADTGNYVELFCDFVFLIRNDHSGPLLLQSTAIVEKKSSCQPD